MSSAYPGFAVHVRTDVVELDRIARLVTRYPAAGERLFTTDELAYCRAKRRCHEHMAARFAAKEAVHKVFGTGIGRGASWKDVEIVNDETGRPHVRLDGDLASRARSEGLAGLDVSLSHAAGVAVAEAVAVWRR